MFVQNLIMISALLSLDYLTYFSLAIGLSIFIFYFSRGLSNWWPNRDTPTKGASSSGTSFDRLVALKEAELKAAGVNNYFTSSSPASSTPNSSPGRPSLAAASKQAYQEAWQAHPHEAQRYQPMLELMENAAWGEGARFREIRQQFKGHCGVEVELRLVALIVHDILANDTQTILAHSTHPPPAYQEVKDLIEAQIWHYLREHQPETLSKAFAARKNLKYEEVAQALAEHPWNKLEIIRGKHFVSVMMLQDELKQAALKVALTRPLPDFKVLDENLAYQLLGAQEKDSATRIKKLYKQAALRYHPDRLAQRGGDVKVAQQNFAKIQQAYQFLKDRRKKAS